MPAVPPSPKAKVLVTGANGYIALWVVRTLLEAGYAVRGSVRSKDKGTHLEKLFGREKGEGRFEVVVVEDITKEGAFDEAVKGVDAIEHTASPFHLKADDPDELIGPAVKGTTGVLHSAVNHAPNVKRIIITSSCAAVLTPPSAPNSSRTFTEEDWNDASVATVKEKGKDAPAIEKYRASKTLAEKAAWAFYEERKGKMEWDLVVLNPPFVFGPVIHDVASPSALNTSAHDWYHTVLHGAPETKLKLGSEWIDVRDLGVAHLKALQVPEAGGERFIVSSGPFVWQDFLDAANALFPPPLGGAHALPKGAPGAGKDVVHPTRYNTAKAAKVLGMSKYISKEECTNASLKDFGERGWVG